ncbi:MAG: hypothetical protein QOJ60_3098 [Actinomycetota bacterium]|jgi:hypothetical protein|nr:hypothetical protein [Actinomycetota bacterium]
MEIAAALVLSVHTSRRTETEAQPDGCFRAMSEVVTRDEGEGEAP